MSQVKTAIYRSCCRLCLRENPQPRPCEDLNKWVVLKERIYAVLSIDIREDDPMSRLICEQCSQKVEDWCKFHKGCQRNQTSMTSKTADKTSYRVKEEVIEDDNLSGNDDLEIVTHDISLKAESMDFETTEASVQSASEHIESAIAHSDAGFLQEQMDDEEVGERIVENNLIIFYENNLIETIESAASLKLVKTDSTPIDVESLSPLENSYLEKCRAMTEMYRSLKCACHQAIHPSLKGLMSHLRSYKLWFPVFTCYNCMITFTDRSSSGKHIHKCPNKNLESLIKLSNLKKRDILKTRIYQNYRCIKCRFVYSFHEDFCKHVDEDHCEEAPDYTCSCRQIFNNVEDFKDHIYVSCMVEYYCDICNEAMRTLQEFINHAQNHHDNSEGFTLLQDDNYKKRTPRKIEPKENKEILGKRRSSTYGRASINNEEQEKLDIALRTPKTPRSRKNIPSNCPQCDKVYSSQANMLRHLRTHKNKVEQEETGTENPEITYYRCPDCQTMFDAAKWEAHKESHKHITCGECDEVFSFQTELEQHRRVHLNQKVAGDTKTDLCKTTVLNPKPELPICKICNILCENFKDLESHKLSHKDLETCIQQYPKECNGKDKVVTNSSVLTKPKAMHMRLRAKSVPLKSRPGSPVERPKSRASANIREEERYHTCKSCSKVFSSKYTLKMHMELHNSNKTSRSSETPKNQQCDKCDMSFSSKNALVFHIGEQHDDKCELEELKKGRNTIKSFESSRAINGRSFCCKICNKAFSSKPALCAHQGWHKRTHTKGPLRTRTKSMSIIPTPRKAEFECSICGEELPNDVALRIHGIEKHGDAASLLTLKCESCNQEYGTRTEYENHMKLHDIVENQEHSQKTTKFSLQMCFDSFSKNETMQAHFKISQPAFSEEYKCSYCDKIFDKQDSLKNHMKVHEKQRVVKSEIPKPLYSCSICRMSFNFPKDLRTHTISSHPF